jgi:hypothetical protein
VENLAEVGEDFWLVVGSEEGDVDKDTGDGRFLEIMQDLVV